LAAVTFSTMLEGLNSSALIFRVPLEKVDNARSNLKLTEEALKIVIDDDVAVVMLAEADVVGCMDDDSLEDIVVCCLDASPREPEAKSTPPAITAIATIMARILVDESDPRRGFTADPKKADFMINSYARKNEGSEYCSNFHRICCSGYFGRAILVSRMEKGRCFSMSEPRAI
jgi:hypothetical protein